LPEYSFNLIAGAPGTGKTTLSQQLMFALATPERPALHFTVIGEPSLKLLRYQPDGHVSAPMVLLSVMDSRPGSD
jgi:circadian clock protein KaiC